MDKIKMTYSQFTAYIATIKGCQFMNVVAITDPDMYKKSQVDNTPNPFIGRVKKVTITPMQFNYSYENAVNNRLDREGCEADFKAEPLSWGAWVKGLENKVIEHKDMLYLRTYCVRNARPRTFYIIDGHLASTEEYKEFSQFFKPSSTSAKQSEAGLEEEKQVKPRNYKYSSLVAVTLNHTRIILVDDKAE